VVMWFLIYRNVSCRDMVQCLDMVEYTNISFKLTIETIT
jgi:hypothetical protein